MEAKSFQAFQPSIKNRYRHIRQFSSIGKDGIIKLNGVIKYKRILITTVHYRGGRPNHAAGPQAKEKCMAGEDLRYVSSDIAFTTLFRYNESRRG